MKVSVLVIAHNEEAHIGACLDSVLAQTKQADEIVVVAHNCTDRTEDSIRAHPEVRLVSYAGPAGPIQARIRGFEEVRNDIVLCTDGDTRVPRNWIEKLVAPFADARVVGVSGPVTITGLATRGPLNTFIKFHITWLAGLIFPRLKAWPMWGPSFGLRKSAYDRIRGLKPLLVIRDELHLETCPDDYYLSLMLRKIGLVPLVFGATVRTVAKEKNASEDLARARMQRREGWRLYRYLRAHRGGIARTKHPA